MMPTSYFLSELSHYRQWYARGASHMLSTAERQAYDRALRELIRRHG